MQLQSGFPPSFPLIDTFREILRSSPHHQTCRWILCLHLFIPLNSHLSIWHLLCLDNSTPVQSEGGIQDKATYPNFPGLNLTLASPLPHRPGGGFYLKKPGETRLRAAPVLLAGFASTHQTSAPNLCCPWAWTARGISCFGDTVGPHASRSRDLPSCSMHCWVVKVPTLCSSPGLYSSCCRRPVMSG